MNLTYRDLLELLAHNTTAEQLQQNVTVMVDDEYYPVTDVGVNVGDDVLDDGHLVLTTE